MSDKSSIEWTDATWNPIRARFMEIQDDGSGKERIGWHCEHLSEGCRHCYAERINLRLGTGLEFKPGHLYRAEHEGFNNGEAKLFLDDKMLMLPLRWKKPRMIFVCSMTDLFADFVPDEWIDKVFAVMALSPQHSFQVLTKRAGRMSRYMTEEVKGPWAGRAWRIDDAGTKRPEWDVAWRLGKVISDMLPTMTADSLNRACAFMDERDGGEGDGFFRRWPLPNVWLGVSTERQQEADERIPLLLQTPAAVRFISAEPLLGPIDMHLWMLTCPAIDWVIVGGESGPHARPMHPDWARSLRDQCAATGVTMFFKQWGEWAPGDGDCVGQQFYRVGKKAAGRLLDGVEHNAMPQVRA